MSVPTPSVPTSGAATRVRVAVATPPAIVQRIVHVTPEMAAARLSTRHANRRVSPGTVAYYGRQMHAGLWRLTGEPIIFADDGTLMNGQHRLEAVIDSGVEIDMAVVENVPLETMAFLDTGRSRSAADVLYMAGRLNTTVRAAIVRRLLAYQRDPAPFLWLRSTRNRFTPSEILDAESDLSGHELERAIGRARRIQRSGAYGGTGVWATLLILFARLDDEQTEAFTTHVCGGADLAADHPLLVLRNVLMRRRSAGEAYMRDEHLAALITKAWNLWRHGQPVHVLIWRAPKEAFPLPE